MCRISGIISRRLAVEQLTKDIRQMTRSMAHGGPDDEGVYVEENIGLAFGHRRLSILDLTAAGHQPMLTPNQNLVITFNGEIYNYPTLKTELEQLGYDFLTNCDTEVILAAYQIWGVASFEKLEGMFAFALFDKAAQQSYLVRDRAGIKPLYYYIQDKQLIFASEVKAFNENTISPIENEDWKVLFLAFGHLPEPFTTLKDVLMLPKGKYLSWNHQSSSATLNTYATTVYAEKRLTEQESMNSVRFQLKQAVASHLLADAPIGVFLSGGVDSSLLTLLTDELIGERLKTVSINFEDERFSEAQFQDIITKKTRGKHQSYLISEAEFLSHFNQALAAMDQPSQDGINSWFVNKCAKDNGLKAVLSGIGADEIFGGYPSFKRIHLAKKLQSLPNGLLKLMANLPLRKFKRLVYLTYKGPIGLYLFLRGSFTPDSIAKLLHTSTQSVRNTLLRVKVDEVFDTLGNGKQASYLETHLYMQNQLLKDTDFMSMAHGVEVRVPFLDQQLMQATQQLEEASLYQHEQPKKLLIDSFIDILPQAIWNRPKMGFTFPFEKWLLKVNGFVDLRTYQNNVHAEKLIDQFKKGDLHWSKAMILYQVFKS